VRKLCFCVCTIQRVRLLSDGFYSDSTLILTTMCVEFLFNVLMSVFHVRWVPCHHGMARPQVADGGDGLQIRRVAASILNKESRTADKGRSSSLEVGRGANNSSP
jgi:hypothetical protein